MKQPNSPQGRVHKFKPRGEWNLSEELKVKLAAQIPRIVKKHRVIVVDRAMTEFGVRRGWVKIATITSKKDDNVDSDLYVPILPTPKNRKTKMQLRLAHDPYGNILTYGSHLRVDRIYTVPRAILEEQPCELLEKSYNGLKHFLKGEGAKLCYVE
ncbi:hypothetical protein F4819DRAFT_475529 [Hypoxylon fuscum]|nr:hypothetical protein F4819DRAFT_475529 [Hypoxylon fuscum]